MPKLLQKLALMIGVQSKLVVATRLNKQEVLVIARNTLTEHIWFAEAGFMCKIVSTSTGLQWQCVTTTKGSGWALSIDDASGKVVECKHWGVR